MSQPSPLTESARLLLQSLITDDHGKYQVNEELFAQFKQKAHQELLGPNVKTVLGQILLAIKHVVFDNDNVPVGQRLADELDSILQPEHFAHVQELVKEHSGRRLEGARSNLARLTGAKSPESEPEIVPREKVELTLPKGVVKG